MKNKVPLWRASPRAFFYFNFLKSLPRTFIPSIRLFFRRSLGGSPHQPTLIVFSISEDHMRVWHYFAKKNFNLSEWRLIIVDSAGLIKPSLFPDAEVFRFLNVYHGRKIDFFIKRIPSTIVLLCDDDQYLMRNIIPEIAYLEKGRTAAVSLRLRTAYYFEIGGVRHEPMGSYALLFRRDIFMRERLYFQSPRHGVSLYKKFPEGVKQQWGYDTADYANERLLLLGYEINGTYGAVCGFDGLSSSHVLLSVYSKMNIARMLASAGHFKQGSINGAVMRSLYCRAQFNALFMLIFGVNPSLTAGFLPEELRGFIQKNFLLNYSETKEILDYYDAIDGISKDLAKYTSKRPL